MARSKRDVQMRVELDINPELVLQIGVPAVIFDGSTNKPGMRRTTPRRAGEIRGKPLDEKRRLAEKRRAIRHGKHSARVKAEAFLGGDVLKSLNKTVVAMGYTVDNLVHAIQPVYQTSQDLVPVDTGELRLSGGIYESDPNTIGMWNPVTFDTLHKDRLDTWLQVISTGKLPGTTKVTIGYGMRGPSRDYAWLVHEVPWLTHEWPTQWKYLSAAYDTHAGDIPTRLKNYAADKLKTLVKKFAKT